MITAGTVFVTTSPTPLELRSVFPITSLYVRNRDATNAIFLGGSASFGTATGYQLDKNETIGPIQLKPGDILYGMASSGSIRVDILAADVG